MITQQLPSPVKVGIIGGLGPKTGFSFAEHLNNRFNSSLQAQPDLLLLNLPVPNEVINRIVNGQQAQEMKTLLLQAVQRLNHAHVDFIVIPCNTVHIFIQELRKNSQKPILSIIEETANICSTKNVKKIGLLASTTTINQQLHTKELQKKNITTIIPSSTDQAKISQIIIRLIKNCFIPADKKDIQKIIQTLVNHGAELILLACTDLQLILSQEDSPIPILDTCKILEDATLNKLLQKT